MDDSGNGGMPNAGRRRFLEQAGAAALGGLLLGGRALASTTHAMTPAEATPDFKPDVEIELAAVVDEVGLLPGAATTVWRITGKVLRGRADALTFLKSSDDGPSFVPVLRLRRGQAFLNGRTFDMEGVADDERVRLGTTEVWEFVNDSPMAHPMHVHNLQFRVIERSGATGTTGDAAGLSAGFTDEGLKDVVLVPPGERVRILMKFENYTGLYLYHCHFLEHEDLGMMRNYCVEAKSA